MRPYAIFSAIILCGTTVAASAPDAASYQFLAQQDLRLATVGYRLAAANAPFCSRKVRNPGWVLHDEAQYPDSDTARKIFGLRAPVGVAAVVPGGPADKAGLKAADGIIAADNLDIAGLLRTTKAATTARVERVENKIADTLASNGKIELIIETADGRRNLVLAPALVCVSKFWVDTKSKLDAGADGQSVRITDALMAFTARDDAELAAVAAHEMAHNILGHRERLAGSGRTNKAVLATEIEADRLSVWLMENAGYDPEAALRFAERYGRKTGLGIFSDGTHLRWKNRWKVMRAEINAMRVAEKKNGLVQPPLLAADQ